MLEPLPSRNVTRFLLPLADVMTLLFAVFLLLPHLEQEPGQQAAQAMIAGSYWTPDQQRQAREELNRLRRLQQLPTGQRLSIIVLDIDGNSGDLLMPQDRESLRLTAANIDAIVQKHQEAARAGDRELFYLLRVQRPQPNHPDLRDEENYRQWFGKWKVEYRIDYPRLGP